VLAVTNMADFDGKPGGLGSPPCSVTTKDDAYAVSTNFARERRRPGAHDRRARRLPVHHQEGQPVRLRRDRAPAWRPVPRAGSCSTATPTAPARAGPRPGDRDRARAGPGRRRARARLHRRPDEPVAGKYFGYLASTCRRHDADAHAHADAHADADAHRRPRRHAHADPTPTADPDPTPTPTPTPPRRRRPSRRPCRAARSRGHP
jgi:hypothetical protein